MKGLRHHYSYHAKSNGKRDIVSVCMLILILCFCLCACHKNEQVTNIQGNTSCNINSGGYVAAYENGVLLTNIYNGKLYYESSLTEEPTPFYNASKCYYLNNAENGIFYTYGSPGRIYFMNDRGHTKKISENRVGNLMLYHDQLYYKQCYSNIFAEIKEEWNTDVDTLFTCNLSGNNRLRIADRVTKYVICNNILYYITYDDYALYSYDIVSKEIHMLLEKNVWDVAVDENYIFYIFFDPTERQNALYRMNLDLSDQICLFESDCTIANMTDEYIFFRTAGCLNRINKDGSEKTQFVLGNIGSVHVFQDKLFFERITQDYAPEVAGFYSINLDGSEEKLLFER